MTIQPQAEDKKITLHVDLSGLQQSDVYSDHEKLTQILLNLAGNAVKYTDRKSASLAGCAVGAYRSVHGLYDILDDGKTQVYSDHEKLTQILLNLAGNAVKYTEANGRIDLIAARKEQLPNDHAVYQFTVQDTGIGISQAYPEADGRRH